MQAGTILFKFLCFMWEFHCRQIIENSAILFDYWKDWLCWLVLWLVLRQTTVKDAYCGVVLLESGMFKEDAWNDIIINKSSWKEITNNKMPVIWTRLIWIPHYFKLKTISLGFTLHSFTIDSSDSCFFKQFFISPYTLLHEIFATRLFHEFRDVKRIVKFKWCKN